MKCNDCKKDITLNPIDYFMINDDLWNSITEDSEIFLCIDCVENKLSRNLTISDFTPCSINYNNPYIKELMDKQ